MIKYYKSASRILLILNILIICCICPIFTQSFNPRYYNIGNPVLKEIWVDPLNGNDNNTGNLRTQAFKSLPAAWNSLPANNTTTGYIIKLVQGDYIYRDAGTGNIVGIYLDEKHGAFSYPIIIESADGIGKAKIYSALDFRDVKYIYLMGLSILTDRNSDGGGNTVHFANGDNIFIKNCKIEGFDGVERKPQETLKINQVSYIYVEDSEISGAFWFALDYVGVQYGHIQSCKIHDAGEDCLLLKGGTAQIRVESNIVYNADRFGLSAGQGAGFDFMVTPWLHFEAYDLKFINNIVYNTGYAGIAVLGGYNILAAYNTFYKIGIDQNVDATLITCNLGQRGCNDVSYTDTCNAHNALGGWSPGPWSIPPLPFGEEADCIPNRNIYIYNNIFYNPAPDSTIGGHLEIRAPYDAGDRSTQFLLSSNISNPALSDDNLRIKGNVIWNGSKNKYLGIGDETGCQDTNKTCNTNQLIIENTINKIEPAFINHRNYDFRIATNSNLLNAITSSITNFQPRDLLLRPAIPDGIFSNGINRDFNGYTRTSSTPPGAFVPGSNNSITENYPLPVSIQLYQNYPNPFNESTIINFELSVQTHVTLKIYDVLGKEITTLMNEFKPIGKYEVCFNARDLAGGVYYYKIMAGEFTATRKIIYLK